MERSVAEDDKKKKKKRSSLAFNVRRRLCATAITETSVNLHAQEKNIKKQLQQKVVQIVLVVLYRTSTIMMGAPARANTHIHTHTERQKIPADKAETVRLGKPTRAAACGTERLPLSCASLCSLCGCWVTSPVNLPLKWQREPQL